MNLSFIRPEYLTPFMFGFCTPFLLALWNKWQKGCILTIFLLWVYFVWFSYIVLMLRSFPTYTTAFFVGFALTFSWRFFRGLSGIFNFLTDKIQDIRYFIADRRRARQWRQTYQEQSTGYEQNRQQREREAEAERARREAEARAYRESQNKQKNQNQQSHDQEEKPHEKRQERQGYQNNNQNRENDRIKDHYKPPENRSYEQILGLSGAWTQADLKEAYKRESQRLHPDKWVGKPQHIQQAMEEEFKVVQEAYKKLKK